MKVFDIPIEPLEERYSTQWTRWFHAAHVHAGFPGTAVYAKPLTAEIETGSFLDVEGTNYYKSQQITKLCEMSYHGSLDNSWLLFHDLWFPGIESLAYIRNGMGDPSKFKIAGCLHAGCWDRKDFLVQHGMSDWAVPFEESFLTIADLIFVATDFHKDLICNFHGGKFAHKIRVTGFPIFPDQFIKKNVQKDPNLIVFPHRKDPEKCVWSFEYLERLLKENLPNLRFVCTKDVCKTKEDYYQLLAEASYAVSFATQETWGIAMQEALFSGCIPFVPNRLSYQEMYHPLLRFANTDDLVEKFKLAIGGGCAKFSDAALHTHKILVELGKEAIPNMHKEMVNHVR